MGYGQHSIYGHEQQRSNPNAGVEAKSKRQRHVYPSNEIPHLWAHQTQDSARNQQGNFYFTGPTIYSYGKHFPIAAHVVNRKGEKAILLTTGKYSNTTSGQVSAVWSAIPSRDLPIFRVNLSQYMLPDNDGKLTERAYEHIVRGWQAEVTRHANNATGARMTKTIQEHLNNAQEELTKLQKFIEFFGLPKLTAKARIPSRKLPFIPATVEAAKELGRAEKQRAAVEAKKERERKAAAYLQAAKYWMVKHPDYATRWNGTIEHAEELFKEDRAIVERKAAEERQRQIEAALADWMREHADVSVNWDGSFDQGNGLRNDWEHAERKRLAAGRIAAWLRGESTGGVPYDIPTMLRVKGGVVETSRGANFPVEHARKGLALVRAVMARGEEWRTNGHTCHLGYYKIERITADGTVYAGCHVVTWPEIERIASELETPTPQESAA